MTQEDVRGFSGGVNQSGVRDYNERLLLSMIQRVGQLPGSDIARQAGLSAQTVSVILRSLEADGILIKGAPQRGRVGKPRVPMKLNPSGAYSVGLKIGRRSADVALMDLLGNVRMQKQVSYRFPRPEVVFPFLRESLAAMLATLPSAEQTRVCGIGIAAPFELWKPHEIIGADDSDFQSWRGIAIAEEVAQFSDLPVSILNDATSACYAENIFGNGRGLRDYAYFFIGAFAGGGVVLNDAVYEGNRSNAGALGSLMHRDATGKPVQLMDHASIFWLENTIRLAGRDPKLLWTQGADWSDFEEQVGPWIDMAAQELAMAALSACAVIDFEAVVIDGAFPEGVRERLVQRTVDKIAKIETIGLLRPDIRAGGVGANARVLGAAYRPIASQYFLGSAGFSATAGA
ncbi:ROK family transcriptional regulator [Phaeobacter sp. J2-8]|uniref:ROK family transcriptional regulator n=1 Tax=Phaeobacter sp. J2-8 TaxID=2931394 RepID=UPI001FD506FD|nr:ROK family transcriptional regulator [Phaeobacter sp. J2-8]MCJ7872696.1 ROK family transcriptional regulator [Phaeobacter sp. J2-8]